MVPPFPCCHWLKGGGIFIFLFSFLLERGVFTDRLISIKEFVMYVQDHLIHK